MSATWPKVRLGEVLTRHEELATILPDKEYSEVTVKLWGKGVVLRGTVSGMDVSGQRRFVARTGQFILSRIDARNGAMGIVPPDLDGALVSNDFPLFRSRDDRLLPTYLGWLSRTATFVEECQRASEGTTNRVRLQETKFLGREIPLPPLDEQRRIVARIEELSAHIDEAKRLRRETIDEGDFIRRGLFDQLIMNANGEFVLLDEVCEAIIDNLHSNPQYAESGIPCVRSPDVGWGMLNLENALCTNEIEYKYRIKRGAPRAGDIVFVREGGGTGKCALVRAGQVFSLGQRVMMVRPNVSLVIPEFMLYQLLAPIIRERQILPLAKGSASPHLNIRAFRKFKFYLPPLQEQRRIVAELDALQAEVDALKRHQTETAAELDALLPTVLDRAFSGRL